LIFLLNSQPYQNNAVEELLATPAHCGTPCWAGIRPGVTSLNHAIDILRGHEWVTEIEFTPTSAPGSGFLLWNWDDPPAHVIDPARQGAAAVHQGIVTSLRIPTALALGDLWLANGQPERAVTHTARTTQIRVRHFMIYDEQSVQWRSAIACPWHMQNFWLARLDLWLGRPSLVEMPLYNRPTRAACPGG